MVTSRGCRANLRHRYLTQKLAWSRWQRMDPACAAVDGVVATTKFRAACGVNVYFLVGFDHRPTIIAAHSPCNAASTHLPTPRNGAVRVELDGGKVVLPRGGHPVPQAVVIHGHHYAPSATAAASLMSSCPVDPSCVAAPETVRWSLNAPAKTSSARSWGQQSFGADAYFCLLRGTLHGTYSALR